MPEGQKTEKRKKGPAEKQSEDSRKKAEGGSRKRQGEKHASDIKKECRRSSIPFQHTCIQDLYLLFLLGELLCQSLAVDHLEVDACLGRLFFVEFKVLAGQDGIHDDTYQGTDGQTGKADADTA